MNDASRIVNKPWSDVNSLRRALAQIEEILVDLAEAPA